MLVFTTCAGTPSFCVRRGRESGLHTRHVGRRTPESTGRHRANPPVAKQQMLLDGSLPNRITATVLGLEAEIEREFIVVRTREALAKRRAEGKPLGAPKGNLQHGSNSRRRRRWSGVCGVGSTKRR